MSRLSHSSAYHHSIDKFISSLLTPVSKIHSIITLPIIKSQRAPINDLRTKKRLVGEQFFNHIIYLLRSLKVLCTKMCPDQTPFQSQTAESRRVRFSHHITFARHIIHIYDKNYRQAYSLRFPSAPLSHYRS